MAERSVPPAISGRLASARIAEAAGGTELPASVECRVQPFSSLPFLGKHASSSSFEFWHLLSRYPSWLATAVSIIMERATLPHPWCVSNFLNIFYDVFEAKQFVLLSADRALCLQAADVVNLFFKDAGELIMRGALEFAHAAGPVIRAQVACVLRTELHNPAWFTPLLGVGDCYVGFRVSVNASRKRLGLSHRGLAPRGEIASDEQITVLHDRIVHDSTYWAGDISRSPSSTVLQLQREIRVKEAKVARMQDDIAVAEQNLVCTAEGLDTSESGTHLVLCDAEVQALGDRQAADSHEVAAEAAEQEDVRFDRRADAAKSSNSDQRKRTRSRSRSSRSSTRRSRSVTQPDPEAVAAATTAAPPSQSGVAEDASRSLRTSELIAPFSPRVATVNIVTACSAGDEIKVLRGEMDSFRHHARAIDDPARAAAKRAAEESTPLPSIYQIGLQVARRQVVDIIVALGDASAVVRPYLSLPGEAQRELLEKAIKSFDIPTLHLIITDVTALTAERRNEWMLYFESFVAVLHACRELRRAVEAYPSSSVRSTKRLERTARECLVRLTQIMSTLGLSCGCPKRTCGCDEIRQLQAQLLAASQLGGA